MSSLIAIFGAIFAFFIVVVVHEYGHFIVARLVGIKVLRFSIGFGKPVFKHRAKSGVEYVIGFLPLGGYVKMQDAFTQDENLPGSAGDAFESKSLIARMAVVLAGPIANLILAFFIFALVFSIGVTEMKPIVGNITPQSIAAKAELKPGDQIIQINHWKTNDWKAVVMFLIMHIGDHHPLSITVIPKNSHTSMSHTMNLRDWQFNPMSPDILGSLGIKPYFPKIPADIAVIMPHSPAAKSALRANDFIVAANRSSIASWQDLVAWVEKHPNESVMLTIRRDHHIEKISVRIGEKNKMGFLGLQPKPITIPKNLQLTEKFRWYESAGPALRETEQWMVFHLVVIKQMLLGRISLKTLGGPVSIFQTAGSASLAGFTSFLQFIAFLSVVLGVLNLLPIPALDGGHFLFFVVEGIIRRPIALRIQVLLINLGIIFLLTMMTYATLNDFVRLLR